MNSKSYNDSVSVQSWISLLLLSLVWGSSFILMKKSLVALSSPQLAGIRIALASLCFLPIALYTRKKVDWSRWDKIALVGVLGSGIPAILYAFAQTKINSSISGILNSLTPIFTFIIGLLFFAMPFDKIKFAGVLIGFLGAVSLVYNDNISNDSSQLLYAGLIVIGTMCYGFSVNIINKYLKDISALVVSSYSFVFIGFFAWTYILFFSDFSTAMENPYFIKSLEAVSVLTIFGTFLSSIVFFQLVKKTDAVFASSVAYLIPIVALMWGYFDGEILGLNHVISMLVIILGVYLIRKK